MQNLTSIYGKRVLVLMSVLLVLTLAGCQESHDLSVPTKEKVIGLEEAAWQDVQQAMEEQGFKTTEQLTQNLYEYGYTALDEARFFEAQAAFSKILEIEGNGVLKSQLGLIDAQLGLRQYFKAIDHLELLQDAYPRNPDVLYRLAKAYRYLGRHSQAASYYKDIVGLQSDTQYGLLARGRFQEAMGHYFEAAQIYENVRDLYPDWPDGHLALANAHRRLEEAGRAKKIYERFVQKFPNRTEGWIGLGELARDARDFKEALEYLEKAKEAQPTDDLVYSATASVYFIQDDLENAMRLAQETLKLNDNNLVARVLAGMIAYRNGDMARAKKELRLGLQVDKYNPDINFYYGKVLEEEGAEPKVVIIHYIVASQNDPIHYQNYGDYYIGKYHYDLQEWDKALFYFERLYRKRQSLKVILPSLLYMYCVSGNSVKHAQLVEEIPTLENGQALMDGLTSSTLHCQS